MSVQLDATLAAKGHAKVVVALTSEAAAAADTSSIRNELEDCFMEPDSSQQASLATANMALSASLSSQNVKPAPKMRIYPHLGLALGVVDTDGARRIAESRAAADVVEAPVISLIRPVLVRPGRLTTRPSWGIRRIKADKLWENGFTGDGIVVGHLDTGIDGKHDALVDAIDEFAEFDFNGNRVAGATAWDSGNHGTHTAGTIVGRPSNDAFGVAPKAKVASGMVIEGGQVVDRILAGMEWVASKGVRILSMSLGLRGFTPAFQVIVDALRNADILPVIAVGNEFANSSRSPGNYANVLSVGAMDQDELVAGFSSSDSFNRPNDPLVPDIVAPGVDILSCIPGNRYRKMNGTSMATPHIAGMAALLLQAKPNASVGELEMSIQKSCIRPASMPEARANRGVPDAMEAFFHLTGRRL
ncbi:S8 family serine peptidase [Anderseniella sp. Alg231-50]|uniref:S8 family serine peptidase n=1 Tax=Anderseniella sp. Alg231-50 TaxID=1922226 RepID=UPI000D551641